jgi:hypothetical protein
MRFSVLFVMNICLCSLSMCHAEGSSSSFRVLIVHEKDIARGMHEIDAKDMKKTFKSVADAVKRPIYITQMECGKASFNKIRKWCSTITPFDTAIVYYSGSNQENSEYNGTWPLIKIGRRSIPVDRIAHKVYSQKARLSLIFVDCYNQCLKPNDILRRFYGHPLQKIKKKPIRQKMRNIWLFEKGSLMMCSNRNGEKGYGIILGKRKFGAFTESLLYAIVNWTHGYGDVLKLSNFPQMINSHMLQYPFSEGAEQFPCYESTITDG